MTGPIRPPFTLESINDLAIREDERRLLPGK
jgi:hypothetical protein